MKKCVFSGTFDPPTTGHVSVIESCLKIFDEVVVAVMINPQKTPLLSTEERVRLLEKLFADDKRVKVCAFDGAAVDLLEREKTPFYVRGIRNTVDFEFENANAFANRKLKSDIVTIYIPAEQQNVHVSSSLVRSSVQFDKRYSDYIPAPILKDFEKLVENRGKN